jgi:hypothetical protein
MPLPNPGMMFPQPTYRHPAPPMGHPMPPLPMMIPQTYVNPPHKSSRPSHRPHSLRSHSRSRSHHSPTYYSMAPPPVSPGYQYQYPPVAGGGQPGYFMMQPHRGSQVPIMVSTSPSLLQVSRFLGCLNPLLHSLLSFFAVSLVLLKIPF